MITNQKPSGRAMSMPVGLLWGAAVSLAVTLLSAAILAKLVDAEMLAWENIGYGIMVLLLLGAVLGAVTAYARIKRQRLIVCVLSGVLYFGIMMSFTALFFGGQYEAVGVTAALILGGSTSVGLLGMRESRGDKRRKQRRLHR